MFRVLCFFVILFVGCAATKDRSELSEPPEKKVQIRQIEDLDPLTLPDENFVIEPKIEDEAPTNRRTNVRMDSSVSIAADSERVKTIQVQGYRVQIGSFSNLDDANEIKRKAMLTFEEVNVYSIFEPPYYKIRVGDFEKDQRREAEALQEKAVSRGFSNAWIVMTIVEKKVKQ